MSKIEQIITEIEEYIDGCKYQPLSSTKITVNKDEIEELLAELRLKIPDEIKKYQKIIVNKNAILNDANEKADEIIRQANSMTAELVSEHEIMQKAYIQANEIVQNATNQAQEILDDATHEANSVKVAAMQYTDDMLANLQNLMTHMLNGVGGRYEELMRSLNENLSIVTSNREELYPEDEVEEDDYDNLAILDEDIEDLEEYEDEDISINLD
ncbi:FliH/SctL family protein [Parasporobacterium paucivorans]|uniref:Vacuolar family H+-ATPase subunit H n=1 Tax=Parasporobacterium paucivorans DSM 15970 TaxID=1122934 RepID=A0A1M6F686_9FIRM|nr:hypothetical protein [Parasporobacterium paucivorans]SHI93191.1 hypothetical protein SAMN02745691_01060 [Parasporobacterium paucivorans DSM 15970]